MSSLSVLVTSMIDAPLGGGPMCIAYDDRARLRANVQVNKYARAHT